MEPTNTGTSEPQKSNTMMFVIGIVVLLLIGVGVVFAMNRNAQPATENTTIQPTVVQESPAAMEATTEPSGTMTQDAGTVKEFTVTGKNFSFSPSVIRVKKGDTVKITFKNTGGIHDFMIDEFDVATPQTQDGASETVEFVADQAGTFDYYCSVGQHRQNGMEGQLIVE
jgi:plastocyanin